MVYHYWDFKQTKGSDGIDDDDDFDGRWVGERDWEPLVTKWTKISFMVETMVISIWCTLQVTITADHT